MPELILHPDVQFEGPPDLEAAVYAGRFEICASRSRELSGIPEEMWRRAAALVCYHEIEVTADLLKRMPRCRVVVRAGVGFDNIDARGAGDLGIAVCNTPDYGTTDVADHAIALMLSFLRGVTMYNSLVFEDPVAGWRFGASPTIRRLSTQTFGVVGLGRIGTAAALRARALGMRVVFFDPYRPTGTELSLGIERCATLEELAGTADVVSIHVPLTAETRHLVSAPILERMKPEAILVNTGRGGSVDLVALAQALLDGRIAGAALDVLEAEPLSPDHPLMRAWRAPGSSIRHKLVVTPHAAFYSPSSLRDLRRKSAETAAFYLCNGWSRDCVNSEAIDPEKAASRAGGSGR
ncbi:C-terminal binding protein [Arenibaculum sp.]|jgi:lactate dehydrogenase-like 2-hydroxyacid dehydrogenase|uniref:C-terminal binding protein n=1 Tax=Arenibaculum sp. TaxID=2865862 RepID=UPI002E0D2E58|nr:C-terminal binding protein [Arenibaculum sp.]